MNLRRNFFLLLSFLFITSSCGKRGEEDSTIPPGILGPHQFAVILADFALAECSANMNIKNTPIQKIDSVYAFDPLREYHIRPSQYDSTLFFYADHPVLYKEVYDSVLVLLSEYKALRNMAKVDSIAK